MQELWRAADEQRWLRATEIGRCVEQNKLPSFPQRLCYHSAFLIYSSRYSLSTAVVSRAPSQSFHSALLSTLYALSLCSPALHSTLAKTFPSQSLAYLIKSHEHQIQKRRIRCTASFPQTRLHLCIYTLPPLLRMPALCRVSVETGCIVLPGLSSSDHHHVHEKNKLTGKKKKKTHIVFYFYPVV